MANVNMVILLGNVGQDPDVRYTPAGQAVCTVSLATNETWTDKKGEKKERAEWHRVVAWGKTAENIGKFVRKGKPLYVQGRLQTREWEKDGVKRYTTEVVADRVQFLGAPPRAGEAPPPGDDDAPGKPVMGDDFPPF